MTNEITFWPATITRRNGDGFLMEDPYVYGSDIDRYTELELVKHDVEWDVGDDGRILVGVDLTRPEREFTVGPYTITIN